MKMEASRARTRLNPGTQGLVCTRRECYRASYISLRMDMLNIGAQSFHEQLQMELT